MSLSCVSPTTPQLACEPMEDDFRPEWNYTINPYPTV